MFAKDYLRLRSATMKKGDDHPDVVEEMNQMSEKQMELFFSLMFDDQIPGGVRAIVDMSYDWYERQHGDGYYPNPTVSPGDSVDTHVFEKVGDTWTQRSGENMLGLDGDYGNVLLKILNSTNLPITAKLCLNRMKNENKIDVLRTPANELTPPEFVLKVVDEMINCGWKAQAEEILSYVGYDNSCVGIINRSGKTIFPKNV